MLIKETVMQVVAAGLIVAAATIAVSLLLYSIEYLRLGDRDKDTRGLEFFQDMRRGKEDGE